MLAQRGASVLGIDQSPFLIAKAHELITRLGLRNVELVQGEFVATSSCSRPRSFDYVLAIDTMVSFDYKQKSHSRSRVVDVFRCVARLLREGGRFFVIESHPFVGHSFWERPFGDRMLCIHDGHYRIRDKPADEPFHWFTPQTDVRQEQATRGLGPPPEAARRD